MAVGWGHEGIQLHALLPSQPDSDRLPSLDAAHMETFTPAPPAPAQRHPASAPPPGRDRCRTAQIDNGLTRHLARAHGPSGGVLHRVGALHNRSMTRTRTCPVVGFGH